MFFFSKVDSIQCVECVLALWLWIHIVLNQYTMLIIGIKQWPHSSRRLRGDTYSQTRGTRGSTRTILTALSLRKGKTRTIVKVSEIVNKLSSFTFCIAIRASEWFETSYIRIEHKLNKICFVLCFYYKKQIMNNKNNLHTCTSSI